MENVWFLKFWHWNAERGMYELLMLGGEYYCRPDAEEVLRSKRITAENIQYNLYVVTRNYDGSWMGTPLKVLVKDATGICKPEDPYNEDDYN